MYGDVANSVRELGPEHTGHFVQPHVVAFCGGDIYSRRKPLFSSFGEHTAVCGSSVPQAVARPRHRQSVCIHNIHVAATCRPSVLRSATKTRPLVAEQSGQCAGALNRDVIIFLTVGGGQGVGHHAPRPGGEPRSVHVIFVPCLQINPTDLPLNREDSSKNI